MDISEIEITEKVHNYTVDPFQGRIGFVYKTEEQSKKIIKKIFIIFIILIMIIILTKGGESSTMVFHS